MIKYEGVQGSMEVVKHLEFNIDTVYVRNNIIKSEKENLWQYDEIQYSYEEWIEFQEKKITILEAEQANINYLLMMGGIL